MVLIFNMSCLITTRDDWFQCSIVSSYCFFRPFDPATYEDEIYEDEVLDEEGRARMKLKVGEG